MKEHDIQQQIRLALGGRPDVRLFRNNCGLAWTGQLVSHRGGRVILDNARPLHAGLHVGSADLIGWQSVVIAPGHVGRRLAVFLSVECKGARGRASEQQLDWLRVCLEHGAAAGIARSPEEAAALLIV